MTLRTLVNGVATPNVAASDRGFAYGDGVFETILVADGEPVWWEAHLSRFRRGCEALGIPCPEVAQLVLEAKTLIAYEPRCVLKLSVTRGGQGRGYLAGLASTPTRVLSLHPAPGLVPIDYLEGIALRWCETRLAIQPRLAGIKHLNRLEQVLARNEWRDDGIAEGLTCDSEGRVVCATAANVFVVRQGKLATPALQRCGIAGIAREWILNRHAVQVVDLLPSDVEGADEVFLCNSLRGILPVARLGGCRWSVGSMTRALQDALWSEVPALRPARESLG